MDEIPDDHEAGRCRSSRDTLYHEVVAKTARGGRRGRKYAPPDRKDALAAGNARDSPVHFGHSQTPSQGVPVRGPGGLVVPVLPIAGLAVAYVSLRIRDARADPPRPELRQGGVLHLPHGRIFLALTGLSFPDRLSARRSGQRDASATIQSRSIPAGPLCRRPAATSEAGRPVRPSVARVAWPLVVSGVLFSLLILLLIKAGTNDARFPSVRRTFVGLRLVVAALNVMFAVTFVIELLFQ